MWFGGMRVLGKAERSQNTQWLLGSHPPPQLLKVASLCSQLCGDPAVRRREASHVYDSSEEPCCSLSDLNWYHKEWPGGEDRGLSFSRVFWQVQ